MTVRIRTFRYPEDYSAAIALWEQSGPGVHIGFSDTPEEIQRKLQRDPELFLVAEEDGRLIGTVLGGFDGRRGMLYHLAVEANRRGEGIARDLMAEVEERLRALGCLKAYLLMIPENPAGEFYKKYQWEEMDIAIFSKTFQDPSC
jgi:ribosomal protein S18 acetylase RimI-like enzyme